MFLLWPPRENDDLNAVSTIAATVPETLAETSTSEHIAVDREGEIEVADLSSSEGRSATGVSFTIDYATQVGSDDAGLVEFDGHDDSVEAVLQATGFGVRVMTVLSDANAPHEYKYTFDVPEGTELVEHGAGSSLEFEDDLFGTLLDPWAVDQNGKDVPTTYTWDSGVLTQRVDLSDPNIAYPVVADPAWSYAYKFAVTKTASANKALLKSCFNCYFPCRAPPERSRGPASCFP